MSKEIPTPYMWSFQPQSGRAAGASQDYSTRMHWLLSAGPSMISRVNGISDLQNQILMRQAAITETPRVQRNPPNWPAQLLPQLGQTPVTLVLPRNEMLETVLSNHGVQLAGGGRPFRGYPYAPLTKCIKTSGLNGGAVQTGEDSELSASLLRPDGIFQLAGGGTSSFDPTNAFLTLQGSSVRPRSGGIGTSQFVSEFVPSIYFNPFSGPPGSFPDSIIPNYDVVTNSIDGYD